MLPGCPGRLAIRHGGLLAPLQWRRAHLHQGWCYAVRAALLVATFLPLMGRPQPVGTKPTVLARPAACTRALHVSPDAAGASRRVPDYPAGLSHILQARCGWPLQPRLQFLSSSTEHGTLLVLHRDNGTRCDARHDAECWAFRHAGHQTACKHLSLLGRAYPSL